MANADNSTDRAFAADQDRFDITSVFVADQIRNEAWRARKVHNVGVVVRVAFDLLIADGDDLPALPLKQRKAALPRVGAGAEG